MPPPHPGQPPPGHPSYPTVPGSRPGTRSNPNDPTIAPTAGGATPPIGSGTFAGPQPGGFVGPYQVVRRLAAGGMGVVYVARHPGLNRQVALKLMRAGVGQHELERFRIEAQASARLQHPHIVAVHDVGMVAGMPYLVMDLIEGRSLKDIIKDDGPMDPDDAARVLQKLAEAVSYAHARSILHRDIKPHNVLIDPAGEPKLTDFGLAKDVSAEEQGLTVSGQVVGTPAYMPPEQAEGELELVDRRADIYSLGATLYEALTGKPVFEGATTANILFKVLSKDAVPPRKLRPELSVDLETICLKCLEKEPEARYPTAQALADDLQRYLADEPIEARPVGLFERLGRKARRNRKVVQGFALFTVALIAALVVAVVQANARAALFLTQKATEAEAAKAAASELKALQAEADARKEADRKKAELAREGRYGDAWAALERGYGLFTQDEINSALREFGSTAAIINKGIQDGVIPGTPGGEGDRIRAAARRAAELAIGNLGRELRFEHERSDSTETVVAFAQRKAAYAFRLRKPGQTKTIVTIADVDGTRITAEAEHAIPISLRFSPNGRILVLVTLGNQGRGAATAFEATSGRMLWTRELDRPHRTGVLTFAPQGDVLIVPGRDPLILNAQSGAPVVQLTHAKRGNYHANAVSASFHPKLRVVAVGYDDGTACIWNIRGDVGIRSLRVHPVQHMGGVNAVAFVPPEIWGGNFLTGGADGTVKLWTVTGMYDAQTRLRLFGKRPPGLILRKTLFVGRAGGVERAVHDRNRALFAFAFQDGKVRLFENRWGETRSIDVGTTGAYGLSMHPSGLSILTGERGKVDMWNLRREWLFVTQRSHGAPLAFGSGRYLAYPSQTHELRNQPGRVGIELTMVDLLTGKLRRTRVMECDRDSADRDIRLSGLALTPDDRYLILSTSCDWERLDANRLYVWERQQDRKNPWKRVATTVYRHAQQLAVSGDGRTLLVGTRLGGAPASRVDYTLRIQELSLPRLNPGRTYRFHVAGTTAISVRDDRFATASEDGTVAVWKRGAGAPSVAFVGGTGLAPGRRVDRGLSGVPTTPQATRDRWQLAIRGADSRRPLPNRSRFATEGVFACGLSPDGRRLVTGSANGVLRWWGLEPSSSAAPVMGGRGRLVLAAYATQDLVVTASDREVRVWDAHTRRTMRVFRTKGGILDAAVGPDGRWVAASTREGLVHAWSLKTVPLPGFEERPGAVIDAAKAPKKPRKE